MAPQTNIGTVTDQQLTELRLTRLEDATEKQGATSRQVEREVDRLKIELPRIETGLQEFRAEATTRHNELHRSLARLHQRFDELAADEHREQGARAERARMWKWMLAAVGAGSAAAGAVAGLISLLPH